MTTAILGVILIVLLLLALKALRLYFQAREAYDILIESDRDPIIDLGTADDLAFDEAEHVKALRPKLTFVPDGFTCLGCGETDALLDSIWCAVCAERVRNFPSSPIDGGKR